MSWQGVVGHSMVLRGLAGHGVVLRGLVRLGAAGHGVAWCGVAWCGVTYRDLHSAFVRQPFCTSAVLACGPISLRRTHSALRTVLLLLPSEQR